MMSVLSPVVALEDDSWRVMTGNFAKRGLTFTSPSRSFIASIGLTPSIDTYWRGITILSFLVGCLRFVLLFVCALVVVVAVVVDVVVVEGADDCAGVFFFLIFFFFVVVVVLLASTNRITSSSFSNTSSVRNPSAINFSLISFTLMARISSTSFCCCCSLVLVSPSDVDEEEEQRGSIPAW